MLSLFKFTLLLFESNFRCLADLSQQDSMTSLGTIENSLRMLVFALGRVDRLEIAYSGEVEH